MKFKPISIFVLCSILGFSLSASSKDIKAEDFTRNSNQTKPNVILSCKKPENITRSASKQVEGCYFDIHGIKGRKNNWFDVVIRGEGFKAVILDPGEYRVTARGMRNLGIDWDYVITHGKVRWQDRIRWNTSSKYYGKGGMSFSIIAEEGLSSFSPVYEYIYPENAFSYGEIDINFLYSYRKKPKEPKIVLEDLSLKELIESSVERKKSNPDIQKIANGVKLGITRSRTVAHVVEIDSKAFGSLELESKSGDRFKWLATVRGEIKGKIEKKLNQTFQNSETYEIEVTLDGSKSEAWEIFWYDKIYKGIAKFEDKNGKVYELPYTFTGPSEIEVNPI